MPKKFAGYKCEICNSRFSGLGSKSRAVTCENLPTAAFKFDVGEKVQIIRNKNHNYQVELQCVRRRAKGSIEPAHVNKYKIVDEKGVFLWIYEFELVKLRVA